MILYSMLHAFVCRPLDFKILGPGPTRVVGLAVLGSLDGGEARQEGGEDRQEGEDNHRAVGVQVDSSENHNFERGCTLMYFQLVDNQVLSTRVQPDVFNLHRLTAYTMRLNVSAWFLEMLSCLPRRRVAG